MHFQLLTDSAHATKTIVDLTVSCDSATWAIAWATDNPVLRAAHTHRAKFKHLVVGTHHYVTAPEALELFKDMSTFRVRLPVGPLFHPKIYLFQTGDEHVAVIGSHNLTRSAFAKNTEMSTLIRSKAGDPTIAELLAFVRSAWDAGRGLDAEWLMDYAASHRSAQRHLKAVDFHPEVTH